MIGKIHDADTLFFRVDVGEAKGKNDTFELSLNGGITPCVRSQKTGKWFTLGWQDILRLAEEAGVSK